VTLASEKRLPFSLKPPEQSIKYNFAKFFSTLGEYKPVKTK